MPTAIVLLRAVNVGGTSKLPMATLKATLEGLGCTDVRTLLASGNAIVTTKKKKGPALEEALEKALAASHGLATDVMVRTPTEWSAVLAKNPMRDVAEADPSHFVVVAFKVAPSSTDVAAFEAAKTKGGWAEPVHVVGAHAYVHYPHGQARTKLSLAKLGVGTARNWSTCEKLLAMSGG